MVNIEELRKVFLLSCDKALELQKKNGEMPSGHNGSYKDKETPVRNTAHWIISFSKALELTKNEKFYDAIVLCLSFLKDNKWRPYSKTFYCREKEGKDKCNGLIGQAWVIEGIIKGYEVTKDKESLKLAEDVFESHPFSEKKYIWNRVELNGEILSFDLTFNHQLWFAMSGFLILKYAENKKIEKRCLSFMEEIMKNLKVSNKGRIYHVVKTNFINDVLKYNLKKLFRKKQMDYMKLKEIGYHSFNTYAFSKILSIYPNLDFFKTKTYKKIITYIISKEYNQEILKSHYGFPYNPPGFESYFTFKSNYHLLEKCENQILNLLKIQIENNYDATNNNFSKNVHDKNTSFARIYELAESL